MRVFVEFTADLDAERWRERHAAGEVPDAAPYGLHRLADQHIRPTFRQPLTVAPARWVARKVRDRLGGLELVTAAVAAARPHRYDAVLCMDERTGVPAALRPGRTPVISGVAWLEDPDALPAVQRRLTTRALSRMSAVFSFSRPSLDLMAKLWDIPDERLHHVWLGIDHDFYPVQPAQPGSTLVVSAGEDRLRDHQLLIDAVASVRGRGVPAALELATMLPVRADESWCTLHPRRMNGGMRELYRRSAMVAVAVHPNSVCSGLTVILEGMASARPVVATAADGMSDYVEHGRTGLLVPPGDPDAFAAAIAELLTDPRRAAEMGRAARCAVEQRFNTAAMAGQLAELLRRTATSR